jgi:hypothetical protein
MLSVCAAASITLIFITLKPYQPSKTGFTGISFAQNFHSIGNQCRKMDFVIDFGVVF